MRRNYHVSQTAYYREQASACAAAAMSAAIAELQQAYLDLEKGWLSLAPKVVESCDGLPDMLRFRFGDNSSASPEIAPHAVLQPKRQSGIGES
jgi:hypothetical protein